MQIFNTIYRNLNDSNNHYKYIMFGTICIHTYLQSGSIIIIKCVGTFTFQINSRTKDKGDASLILFYNN